MYFYTAVKVVGAVVISQFISNPVKGKLCILGPVAHPADDSAEIGGIINVIRKFLKAQHYVSLLARSVRNLYLHDTASQVRNSHGYVVILKRINTYLVIVILDLFSLKHDLPPKGYFIEL